MPHARSVKGLHFHGLPGEVNPIDTAGRPIFGGLVDAKVRLGFRYEEFSFGAGDGNRSFLLVVVDAATYIPTMSARRLLGVVVAGCQFSSIANPFLDVRVSYSISTFVPNPAYK